jgi:DNA-binding beta-propeller fold protein YncE
MARPMGRSSTSARALAAIAALCALFFCVGSASASAAPLVWTANSSQGSVSTIDGATGAEVGLPIPVGEGPASLAITPNGRRAVVATKGGKTAKVIDTASRTVLSSFPLPAPGVGVAISPDGKSAYVTSESKEVLVIEPEAATARGTIELGRQVEAVAFSPDGRRAYFGLTSEEIVSVDTQTGEVVGSPIMLRGRPRLIAFTPDGNTAYVIGRNLGGIAVVNMALDQVVKTIGVAEESAGIAVSPDGQTLYVGFPNAARAVIVVATGSNSLVGPPIEVPGGAGEIAIAPDGKTAYAASADKVTPINLLTREVETAIPMTGDGVLGLAITPDQSPVAAFTAPSATAGAPATFSGAGSSDPDGSVVAWNWAFGDGGTASGASASHTYGAPGTYEAKLSVVDDQGCGEAVVFTGRTAYCSGSPAAVHAVTAAPAPVVVAPPSNRFRIRRVIHNRRNGTVRLQVRLPSAGFVLLFGKKVHAVTRKSRGVQSMWLTVHARVELAKRLKKVHRARVRFRVTFTPDGGTARTVHRGVTLQRKPRQKHHHRGHRH